LRPYTLLLLLLLPCITHAQARDNDTNYRKLAKEQRREQRRQHRDSARKAWAEERALMKLYSYDTVNEQRMIDIHLGYGILTYSTTSAENIVNGRDDGFDAPEPLGTTALGAKYYISPHFALGLCFAVEHLTGKRVDYYHRYAHIDYKQRVITIAPEVTFVFRAWGRKSWYCVIAPGYSRDTRASVTTGHFNLYQAAGFRYGGRLGGFAELGFGFRGLFNCGLSYKF